MEIKFRVWDIRDKKFVDNIISASIIYEIVANPDSDVLQHFIIMMFTGLHDKNGKEIYECDLCKIPVSINVSLHGNWSIYQFVIRNGITMLSYLRSDKDTGIPEGYLSCPYYDKFDVDMKTVVFANHVTLHDCEIIGNIYQNPELL